MEILPEDSRFTTFPITRPELFAFYELARDCFWTPNEICISDDITHFKLLNKDEQHFIKYILAFFAASDGLVNLNIASRFKSEINILEVTYFYNFQMAMEDIHAHVYSMLLDTIIQNKEERTLLLNAMNKIAVITEMSNFIFKCVDSKAILSERLLRMACVEGIFFTGCFLVIYWLQNRGLMPALGHSNELIARDEAMHTLFALKLYTLTIDKLSVTDIHSIITEAVNLAIAFIKEALPGNLP